MAFGLLLLGACAADNLGSSSAAVDGVGDVCTVDADCINGLECDDGACKQHGGHGNDNHGGNADGGVVDGVGDACTVDADCINGLECDDGACKQHGGGNGGGNDDGAGHEAGDDNGNDGGGHDAGDDHGHHYNDG